MTVPRRRNGRKRWASYSAFTTATRRPGLYKAGRRSGFLQDGAREVKLRLEQIAIRIERVELGVDAATVAEIGEPETVLQGRHERFLLAAALADALISDQRVGISVNAVWMVFRMDQGALALGLGQASRWT